MADDEIETVDEAALHNADTETAAQEQTKPLTDQSGHRLEALAVPKQNSFQSFWAKYKANKKLSIPLTVLALILIILGVPATRYATLGLVIKKDLSVKVIDSLTNTPISGVDLSVGGKTGKTDAQGSATIKGIRVGSGHLTATKEYYKNLEFGVTTPVTKRRDPLQIKLEATGRQVPIHITNKITGNDVADATVKAADTEARTDKSGHATLVLPANELTLSGTVAAKGYNDASVNITISQTAVKDNTFTITPAGKVYFLSKKSGKIDVVKTDLDGSNRQTVIAGTGKEEDTNTVLLASRDWKYLALQSRRDSDQAKLYLIDTNGDKLSEIDSGDAAFAPVGWNGHYFVYKISRNNVPVWQAKGAALKTFNAETQQSTTVDESNAEGSGTNDYAAESLDGVYILSDALIYSKSWSANYYSNYRLADKRMGIYTVKPNGTGKQLLKDFPVGTYGYITAVPFRPSELYFTVSTNSLTGYYVYQNGAIKESKDITADTLNKFNAVYLASPGSQNTFWYEPRDGKNTLFTGTANGDNPKEIASLSEYTPYGWYTDDYLLVSKGDSELFILPVAGPGDRGQLLKVTDYHKPNYSFKGYGYGGF